MPDPEGLYQFRIKDCETSLGIEVTVDPKLNGFLIQGNRECLYLVLRNLHENAVEHTTADGTISWSSLPNGVGIAVEDEGPGIAEDEIPLVTRRFYRTLGTKSSGTGLGLAIASIAAERLGMQFTIANRPDRSGLRCTLSRPPQTASRSYLPTD
ncbi:MAG: sensor histidine kinase [Rhizobiales bacterium]|jgi:two-component system sensor histidine kinase QseC|nr:sensor histidine kinase [Hyphomicrobiales bacterium]